ncbi:MAG: hypothetical protein AABY05_00825 [Nanoarchaeota archaeon]
MEKEVSDEYMKKVEELADNHFKKYRVRKMSIQELDTLTDLFKEN